VPSDRRFDGDGPHVAGGGDGEQPLGRER